MAGDPERPGQTLAPQEAGSPPQDELESLRQLLIGAERGRLVELEGRIERRQPTIEEVAAVLPEAIAERSGRDRQLARALLPSLESGIAESVRRNPAPVADAIYPTLGPAIRKAVSETIAGFVETLNRAIDSSLSIRGLRWRIEAWRTGVPYGEIILREALVYRVEQVFLIHKETGLLLSHAAADPAHARDPDLVSGMLTAIRDFVTDSFEGAAEDGLKRFSVGQRTVVVEAGPTMMLAAAVRGEAPQRLTPQLQEALETLHLQLHHPLDDFDGDTEKFEIAQPTLESCLETVLTTDQPKDRSLAPKIAWSVAGLVVLALVGMAVWSSLRWRSALALIRDQPGLVLVDADRSFGRWRVSGLRDPLAAKIPDLLAGAGFEPRKLVVDFRPYLSAEPAVLRQRATALLAPPASVSLETQEGGLRASGTATPRWIDQARANSASLAVFGAVDLSGVTATRTAELDVLHDELENQRVLFEIGSARLEGPSVDALEAAAGTLRRLQTLADEDGWDVELNIVGRTDATGTERLNRVLSEQRAAVVQQALERLGLVPDRVTFTGLGIDDPLDAADPRQRARLNRSTSFSVDLTHPPGEFH